MNMKPAGTGSPVEWHQDWAFYPHTNDDILAVGVVIDDMRLDNGCLMVVPGSHHDPVLDHHAARPVRWVHRPGGNRLYKLPRPGSARRSYHYPPRKASPRFCTQHEWRVTTAVPY